VYPWSAWTILLSDDTACPIRSNILYAAYTGGNNSGEMRHPNPIFRRTGAPTPVASTSGSVPRIVAQVVMRSRRRGQMCVRARINRAVFDGVYWGVFLTEHEADRRGSFTAVERSMSDRFLACNEKECLPSHLASSSSFAWLLAKDYGVLAHRNPGTYWLRNDGGSKYRSAARRFRALVFQEPPRITLNPPVGGPAGLSDGLFL